MPFRLLQCLARAAAKNGVRFLASFVPGGAAVYDIAADALEHYRLDQHEGALRAEVQALAQAPPEQVRREVEGAVKAEAAGQSPEVREALTDYLGQVPDAIRRSLRRPSDATGTTLPPDLALRWPEDLARLLPPRRPRFKRGDCPLPGVDWELEELVGVGGFGEVWKARHTHLKSKPPVALKFCLDASAVAALRNEAGVLDRVMQHGRHPGIVPLLHTYLSADPPCLEYEFIAGGDLAGLIREQHGKGKMALGMPNRLFQRLAEIVAFAHRADPPIVHGDLKPANVLVRRGIDNKVALRVTDFGIGGVAASQAAREKIQPTRSRQELLTEAVRGAYTPLYASPEQMARHKGEPADPRDDVHALGVIWYQLLTGDLGMMSIPSDWREQLTERGLGENLTRLLAGCLAPRAEKRPASAAVVASQLAALLGDEAPAPAPPPKPPPPLPKGEPRLVLEAIPATRVLAPPVACPAAIEPGKLVVARPPVEDDDAFADVARPGKPGKRLAMRGKPSRQRNAVMIGICVSIGFLLCGGSVLFIALISSKAAPRGTELKIPRGAGNGDTTEDEVKETPVASTGWATIKGTVTYDGTPPPPVKLDFKEHAECLKDAPDEDKIEETWLVGPKGEVANVVVWVLPPSGKYFKLKDEDKDRKNEVITLRQPHCAFHPHVLAIYPSYDDAGEQKSTGQKLVVLNDAKFPHNTQIEGNPLKNPTWDTGQMSPQSKKMVDPSRKPQDTPLSIKCNIHQWMKGKIWVFDNPYHAVTKEDGTFEIKNVPGGAKLTFMAWHEGTQFVPSRDGQEIGPLMDGDSKDMSFKIKAK
jgi:serine/threonine protein kinase